MENRYPLKKIKKKVPRISLSQTKETIEALHQQMKKLSLQMTFVNGAFNR